MPLSLSDLEETDGAAPTRLVDVDGIGITEQQGLIGFNRVPPDHNGAVGPDHVVSVLNHVMQIYDKGGNLISTQQLENLFGVVSGITTLPVDPNLLYDQASGRFVYVSFEVAGTTNGPINASDDQVFLNVAVSQTSDPTDGWHVSSIDAKTFIGGQNTWSDYPGVAVDAEAVYITANMFDFDGGPDGNRDFKGNRLWIIDKGEGTGGLYDGGAISFSVHDPVASATDLTGLGVSNATHIPARYASNLPGESGIYLVAMGGLSNGVNEIAQIIHVTNPLGSPNFTAQSVSLGDISNENLSFLPQATQLGTSNTLGSGDPRVNSGAAVWFEGKLYFTSSVTPKTGPDAGQTTTHWVELDANNPSSLVLIQQGNIGGEDIAPGTHTFHSSINVNKDGAVLINYSASGPSIYPGAYYALRSADDPIGQFSSSQTLRDGLDWYFRTRAGEGISSQTINRWGDFSGVSVDPSDGSTFWFFNMYADTRGSPNGAGQDGRWRVTLGSARPTVQNFQFNDNDADENFYGGLGLDGLQFNALGTGSIFTVSPEFDGAVKGEFSSGATAKGYFIEYALFQGGASVDLVNFSGDFSGTAIAADGVVAAGAGGGDLLSAAGLTSPVAVLFNGEAGADTLLGGLGGDTLFGGNDNDSLSGGDANDSLYGGFGADTLRGESGNDFLSGAADNDILDGGLGNDLLSGGSNNDSLVGGDGADTLYGNKGVDTLSGGDGNDLLSGAQENDLLDGEEGNDSLFGGSQNDLLFGRDGNDSLDGGSNADTLYGNNGADTLMGGLHNDLLSGANDNDVLDGGDGIDSLFGGAQNDLLLGRLGDDSLDGGSGGDTLYGNEGADTLWGQAGGDLLSGSADNDIALGGDGEDTLLGGANNDELIGGNGEDALLGGNGDDTLYGNFDNDLLQGEAGNDFLSGAANNDILEGGDGDDFIAGGAQNDFLTGGSGDDEYYFAIGDNIDTLTDFTAGAGSEDVIQLAGFGVAYDTFAEVMAAATDDGIDTTINFGGGDIIVLQGVTVAQLHQDDFSFI